MTAKPGTTSLDTLDGVRLLAEPGRVRADFIAALLKCGIVVRGESAAPRTADSPPTPVFTARVEAETPCELVRAACALVAKHAGERGRTEPLVSNGNFECALSTRQHDAAAPLLWVLELRYHFAHAAEPLPAPSSTPPRPCLVDRFDIGHALGTRLIAAGFGVTQAPATNRVSALVQHINAPPTNDALDALAAAMVRALRERNTTRYSHLCVDEDGCGGYSVELFVQRAPLRAAIAAAVEDRVVKALSAAGLPLMQSGGRVERYGIGAVVSGEPSEALYTQINESIVAKMRTEGAIGYASVEVDGKDPNVLSVTVRAMLAAVSSVLAAEAALFGEQLQLALAQRGFTRETALPGKGQYLGAVTVSTREHMVKHAADTVQELLAQASARHYDFTHVPPTPGLKDAAHMLVVFAVIP